MVFGLSYTDFIRSPWRKSYGVFVNEHKTLLNSVTIAENRHNRLWHNWLHCAFPTHRGDVYCHCKLALFIQVNEIDQRSKTTCRKILCAEWMSIPKLPLANPNTREPPITSVPRAAKKRLIRNPRNTWGSLRIATPVTTTN